MGAQTSSSAQEKFWGSLLKKYGPTAARLAGHAIKAYMGLAQTSTSVVEKEKFLFAALAAAKLGYTAYKMFSLPQVANFKKADHYMALSQTATSVKEKEKFLFAALAAAKLGYTACKMFSLTQTTTTTAAQTKFWGSLLKKYRPTAARLAGHAIKAYMGLAQTSSAAQEKFWGSLLRKYGPTAAKLAGHAIKAYMGLAQTATSAEEKAKLLGMALTAHSVTARHFSLSQNAT